MSLTSLVTDCGKDELINEECPSGSGWQILTAPVITYDWKADSDEALSLPLGTGIAKTTKFGRTTWRFQMEVWYYAVQPDSFGSDWVVSFDVRPIIQNPLLDWFR